MEAHRRQAKEIADRAVTLVSNRVNRIPLPSGRTAVVHVGGDDWVAAVPRLGTELAARLPDVTVAAVVGEILEHAWDNVVAVSLSWRSDQGAQVIEALYRRFGERLVVVGAGNPYELLRFPDVGTYLAAYGPDPASMCAAARILSGDLHPAGRLPVALPGLYPRGHAA